MAIKKVTITDDCIMCGMCMGVCPEVFQPSPNGDKYDVVEGVDYNAYEDSIKEAAAGCPVAAIEVEE